MWAQLAIFVVTTILSYLLRDRSSARVQRPTDAAPQTGEAPEALTAGAIPVVFGTVWVSPNVCWYGDLEAQAITETVPGGGGGGKK